MWQIKYHIMMSLHYRSIYVNPHNSMDEERFQEEKIQDLLPKFIRDLKNFFITGKNIISGMIKHLPFLCITEIYLHHCIFTYKFYYLCLFQTLHIEELFVFCILSSLLIINFHFKIHKSISIYWPLFMWNAGLDEV